jgi:hypothetical protein
VAHIRAAISRSSFPTACIGGLKEAHAFGSVLGVL